MLSFKLFDILDKIGKTVNNNFDKPCGGIQLVFLGDFFQLPPISKKNWNNYSTNNNNNVNDNETDFCFKHPLFMETFPIQIEFTKVFRQKDPLFTKILNQIRTGKISKNSVNILSQYVNREYANKDIIPTKLCPKKKQVEMVNKLSMEKINTECKEYISQKIHLPNEDLSPEQQQKMKQCMDQTEEYEFEYMSNNINCEKRLELKVGCQVMCIINLDIENQEFPIGNGSIGVIINFTSNNLPIVSFKNGLIKTIGYHDWISEEWPGLIIRQIPLILAWAISIHKSQGSTLEMAELDIGEDIFECGQTYVALSRIISLEGLYLSNFNPYKIKVNKDALLFYERLIENQKLIDFKENKIINNIFIHSHSKLRSNKEINIEKQIRTYKKIENQKEVEEIKEEKQEEIMEEKQKEIMEEKQEEITEEKQEENKKKNKNKLIKKEKKLDEVKTNCNKRWTIEDDYWLFYNKNQEIEILSMHFQRTINSIVFRIKHLEDKEHPSNIRLMTEINKKKNTYDEKHIAIEIEGI